MTDVLIVGGGIIGLAVAHEAQERGAEVLVLDAGERPAADVAAGMLAPITEADFGEEELVALGLESLERYPAFCDALGVELRAAGTLVVARDADDAAVLDRVEALRQSLGLASQRLLPSRARSVEPALAPSVRLAYDVPGDRSVDPRALLAALRARVPVREERVTELTATSANGHRADQVVLAAGAWSGTFGAPVRPVKGQILRLRGDAGLVERTVRTPDAYLVPRGDGRYVLGGTVEDRGWHDRPTAGGVLALIRDMAEVVPGVLELDLEEVAVGFRPATADNRPRIERREDGVVVATGHWRNGILLAPLTAHRVGDLLARVPA